MWYLCLWVHVYVSAGVCGAGVCGAGVSGASVCSAGVCGAGVCGAGVRVVYSNFSERAQKCYCESANCRNYLGGTKQAPSKFPRDSVVSGMREGRRKGRQSSVQNPEDAEVRVCRSYCNVPLSHDLHIQVIPSSHDLHIEVVHLHHMTCILRLYLHHMTCIQVIPSSHDLHIEVVPYWGCTSITWLAFRLYLHHMTCTFRLFYGDATVHECIVGAWRDLVIILYCTALMGSATVSCYFNGLHNQVVLYQMAYCPNVLVTCIPLWPDNKGTILSDYLIAILASLMTSNDPVIW